MLKGTWKFLILGISVLLLVQGCGEIEIVVTPAPSKSINVFTPIPTFTLPPPPSTTFTPQLPAFTATTGAIKIPASSPGPGPHPVFYVTTSADNVNLRTKPGTLFPVSRLLANGTRLQVQGRSPGGQWLYVLTDSNIYGWVLVDLVQGRHDGGPFPLVEPQDVQIVKGQVLDLAGVPVTGIGFAITQGSGPKAPRTDAATDGSGRFYAYLPLSISGQWQVSFVSVACTSNTMDANCNCLNGVCGRADPDSRLITLPYTGTLQFTWR
jgi:hypothetical protein